MHQTRSGQNGVQQQLTQFTSPLAQNTRISTIFTMGEWPYLCTQACYRQKWGTKRSARQWSFRGYVIRPSNSTTASIRKKGGYFPHTVGYFPTKKTETIDLETVVSAVKNLYYINVIVVTSWCNK
jgi:hypothetical protein